MTVRGLCASRSGSRERQDNIIFIYAGSRERHHQREAALRDAQGAPNIAEELANHRLAAVDDGALSPGRPGVRPTPETDSAALHFGLHCITEMYHRNVYR
jgi:hypothetical protein